MKTMVILLTISLSCAFSSCSKNLSAKIRGRCAECNCKDGCGCGCSSNGECQCKTGGCKCH